MRDRKKKKKEDWEWEMANVRPFHLIITITLPNKQYLHLLFRKVKYLSVERSVGVEVEVEV